VVAWVGVPDEERVQPDVQFVEQAVVDEQTVTGP
jgi:hypothetical protein